MTVEPKTPPRTGWEALKKTAQPEGEAPPPEDAELRIAMAELAWEQQEGYRADVVANWLRFAKGMVMWQTAGWEWQPPTGTDPEKWPPLAKMLYVYLRADGALTRANFAKHFQRPSYCPSCQDKPAGGYGVWLCPEHTDWRSQVMTLAADMFPEAGAAAKRGVSQ